jgi:hypothetical protein
MRASRSTAERSMSPEDRATLELLEAAFAAESAAAPAGPPPAVHLNDLARAVERPGRLRLGGGRGSQPRRRRPPRRR